MPWLASRTAYPRFPRTLTLKDLQASFIRRPEEIEWAQGFARTAERRNEQQNDKQGAPACVLNPDDGSDSSDNSNDRKN
ncbi:hypothetical protein [Cupriavidus necator]